MKDYLDFEQPIIELQTKLEELTRSTQNSKVEVDFENEANQIRKKIEKTRKTIYSKLTPWQRIQLARHPRRPYTLDYINNAFEDFTELHGDRLYSDDRAIVSGFAKLDNEKVMVMGTQKGRDTKENILRNFGCAHPEGYRKALRLMKLASKFSLPIITVIDTAGA
ncbi:MAG: carboxyl transferase domain-containing protein, partial [Verrucomicrobiota bacterium]|nr:carboxyl transferase domain-containing protein [Verrucomicrobiota bacterium]